MKRAAIILTALFLLPHVIAADRPKAPRGFEWRNFPEVHCALQVPTEWHVRSSAAGLTKIVVVSPEKTSDQGFDTGFTMQAVYCKTPEDWNEAMRKSGAMMKDARDAIEKPIVSKIDKTDEMLYMVVEGVRKIPDSKRPGRLYHVRNVVRAFPKSSIVYVYSFGALAEEWDTAWKTGRVIFSVIDYVLPE